jgi:hypothetical protein
VGDHRLHGGRSGPECQHRGGSCHLRSTTLRAGGGGSLIAEAAQMDKGVKLAGGVVIMVFLVVLMKKLVWRGHFM